MNIFRTQPLNAIAKDVAKTHLKKTLDAFDLILLGIGAIIGTGIFVLTGVVAAKYAGPAVTVSYLIAGIVCVFTALAYIEMAAMVPAAGSSYSYCYTALGEIVAWLVGWFLMMEYTVGSSLIAAGWSGYILGILKAGGITLPHALTTVPSQGGWLNLPAVAIILFVTLMLVRGTKESARLNTILVFVKLAAILLFIILAVPKVNLDHWQNFLPYGTNGVATGTATVILAYVGFDALATAAEESKNPRRDLPIAIIISLAVCTILYMLVAAALTAIVPYTELDNAEPMAHALRLNGSQLGSLIVAVGALAGITTALIVQIYGQSRILFVMARDGMVPLWLTSLHPRYDTPYRSTYLIGILVAIIAGVVPIELMGHLANVGTLISFISVSLGVLVLRYTQPTLATHYKTGIIYPASIISAGASMYLLSTLMHDAWEASLMWGFIGLIVYFIYSYHHSHLHHKKGGIA